MAEYANIKAQMDILFVNFEKAEIGTTVSLCEMPYDETTILNESNITMFLQKLEE